MRLFRRSKETDAATDEALERTKRSLFDRMGGVFQRSDVTDELWESLEEVLIGADTGVQTTFDVLERVRAREPRSAEDVRSALREELIAILRVPDETTRGRLWGSKAEDAGQPERPAVVLVVGVNGTGKTTAVARLAHAYIAEGDRVMAAAGDTCRAAAIPQLTSWGSEVGFDVIGHQQGADAAAVAFDAIEAAAARGHDIVFVDTAGRLHNKQNLMAELEKIRRVIERHQQRGPDEVLLILDATTGQNGLAQARAFTDAVDVTSVMLTKLDGTAKGGIVFAIASELGLPVRFIGTGDSASDVAPFDPEQFVDALLGAPQATEA